MDKVDTEKIEYKIDSINIISHTQKDFSEYGLKSSDIKSGKCQLRLGLVIDSDKSCITIPMKITVSVEHENKKHELFSTEAEYTYRIKKMKSLFIANEADKYDIPDEFIRTLIGTALSGMRGIMVASTTIPEYKKIILPLIGTSNLLEEIKKKQLEMTSNVNPSSN